MKMTDLYQQICDTAISAGLRVISTDTAARILAVTYVHGNNEFMNHNPKYLTDVRYIQKVWNIDGGCTPDPAIIPAIKSYVADLEEYEKEHPKERYALWAIKLFKERYGVELIN